MLGRAPLRKKFMKIQGISLMFYNSILFADAENTLVLSKTQRERSLPFFVEHLI